MRRVVRFDVAGCTVEVVAVETRQRRAKISAKIVKPKRARRAREISAARADELDRRWFGGRSRVMARRGEYGEHYAAGYRVDPLPTADQQARRMR